MAFAEAARAAGIPVEVVSDGFGFFIEPALAALGVPWIPVVTADTRFGPDGPSIAFPNGDPHCFVCGTCKRNRVLAHQAAGRRVVFIGDGESDRFAAGYADVVFAKHSLERFCLERGWPFERWTAFSEIHRWLEGRAGVVRGGSRVAARSGPAAAVLWRGDLGPGSVDPPGVARLIAGHDARGATLLDPRCTCSNESPRSDVI